LAGSIRFAFEAPDGVEAMQSLGILIVSAISIYIWVLIASAIFSWLIAFNVLNARNQIVDRIGEVLYRVTEPALRPIRRFVPYIGGIDISPILLILLLIFARNLIYEYWL
jgi:YggT family protein